MTGKCVRGKPEGVGQEKAPPGSSRRSGGQQGERTDRSLRGAQGLPWGLHRLTSWGVRPRGRTLTATNLQSGKLRAENALGEKVYTKRLT